MKSIKDYNKRTFELTSQGDIKSLLSKMASITRTISSIPKNGNNTEYDYVTERDVVNVIRGKLVENNIYVIPSVVDTSTREVSTSDGKKTSIVKVVMSYTFFDMENGSYIRTYYQGEGEDILDKGIYKAMTGCQKYALLKTFLIPTGDDPEEKPVSIDNYTTNNTASVNIDPEARIPEGQARELYHTGRKNKKDVGSILAKYGYGTTFEIQEKHRQAIEKELNVS